MHGNFQKSLHIFQDGKIGPFVSFCCVTAAIAINWVFSRPLQDILPSVSIHNFDRPFFVFRLLYRWVNHLWRWKCCCRELKSGYNKATTKWNELKKWRWWTPPPLPSPQKRTGKETLNLLHFCSQLCKQRTSERVAEERKARQCNAMQWYAQTSLAMHMNRIDCNVFIWLCTNVAYFQLFRFEFFLWHLSNAAFNASMLSVWKLVVGDFK